VTHVFISYKREDEVRVARIARALEQAGLELWWDRGLPGGESWHANIEAKLDAAGCVVVIWSRASIAADGHYVRDEARRGLMRGILVPVLIDPVADIPLGFGEVQAIDLSRWSGDPRDPFLHDLIAAVRAKLDGAPPADARGPKARVARQILWGGAWTAAMATAAVVALATGGGPAGICAAPALQPGLSDICGALGVGARPTKAERLAWAARPSGSCPALRDHVARFPDGAYRALAADLLTSRQVTIKTSWAPVTRPLAQFVAADGAGERTEAAAKARALERAKASAERLCRGFGAGNLFRFVGATSHADQWSCADTVQGVVCGFEGVAACALEERREIEEETCGPVG
jgi:hypothetical protein